MSLTVREHMALAVETARWKHLGAKEAHVREVLGLRATSHSQMVNSLLDRPEAEREYPMLVRRLRRLRDQRRASRRSRLDVGYGQR